jgi:hypothetical protein
MSRTDAQNGVEIIFNARQFCLSRAEHWHTQRVNYYNMKKHGLSQFISAKKTTLLCGHKHSMNACRGIYYIFYHLALEYMP